jgi:hypothetical protein
MIAPLRSPVGTLQGRQLGDILKCMVSDWPVLFIGWVGWVEQAVFLVGRGRCVKRGCVVAL